MFDLVHVAIAHTIISMWANQPKNVSMLMVSCFTRARGARSTGKVFFSLSVGLPEKATHLSWPINTPPSIWAYSIGQSSNDTFFKKKKITPIPSRLANQPTIE
jgi:hypothetical protein